MTTVLITQCLQCDFADPIGPHDPPANLLPAGSSDAAHHLAGRARRSDGMAQANRAGSASRCPGVRQDLALFGRLVAEGELARDHHLQHELIHHIGSVRESALTGHPQWPQDPSRRTQAVARAVYRVPPSRSIRNPTVR